MNKELDKLYEILKKRQEQLGDQLAIVMEKQPIIQSSMLVITAQSFEIQRMLWIIEDLGGVKL